MKKMIEGRDYSIHEYITKDKREITNRKICPICRECEHRKICSNRANPYAMRKYAEIAQIMTIVTNSTYTKDLKQKY